MESPDVLITGGGPAGLATALFLVRANPTLASRILVTEKRRHPRHKVCAGGLIPHTLGCLRELEIPLSVPHARVHRASVAVPGRRVDYEDRDLCAVVRRNDFDAYLADVARQRGICLREEEKVEAVLREGGALRVLTSRGEIRPRLVVGADGSGSVVRRSLFAPGRDSIGRAVMCDVDATKIGWRGLEDERYLFDFRAVPRGLRGYVWEFPCWIEGRPHVNLGAYALDRGGDLALPGLVREHARELGAGEVRLEAFPIRWYDPATPIGAEGALLVGDAAGCDPLMGEGISYAFEYGRLAAQEIARALRTAETDFAGYSVRVRDSWFGRKLRRLRLASRVLYGPAWKPLFTMAARSRRLQDAGIRWYNGVDDWDRVSGWRVFGRLIAGARS